MLTKPLVTQILQRKPENPERHIWWDYPSTVTEGPFDKGVQLCSSQLCSSQLEWRFQPKRLHNFMEVVYRENRTTYFQVLVPWRNQTSFRTCPLHQPILLAFSWQKWPNSSHLLPVHYIKGWRPSSLHTLSRTRPRLLPHPVSNRALAASSAFPDSPHPLFSASRLPDPL